MNTNSDPTTAGIQASPGGEVISEHGRPDRRSAEEGEEGEEAAAGQQGAPQSGSREDQPATAPGRFDAATDERLAGPAEAVARRTPTGWRVGDEEVPDLTSAMVLADLLAADLLAADLLAADLPSGEQRQAPGDPAGGGHVTASQPAVSQQGAGADGTAAHGTGTPGSGTPGSGTPGSGTPGSGTPGSAKPGPGIPAAETPAADAEQLKETVAQLERALTVRVRVEQAIGVLAERHKLRPRQAFELLRSASRARGARVSQTAGEVVASVTNPLLRIPEELARQPEGHRGRTPRHARRKA